MPAHYLLLLQKTSLNPQELTRWTCPIDHWQGARHEICHRQFAFDWSCRAQWGAVAMMAMAVKDAA